PGGDRAAALVWLARGLLLPVAGLYLRDLRGPLPARHALYRPGGCRAAPAGVGRECRWARHAGDARGSRRRGGQRGERDLRALSLQGGDAALAARQRRRAGGGSAWRRAGSRGTMLQAAPSWRAAVTCSPEISKY